MAKFHYIARDFGGKKIEGTIESDNIGNVVVNLKRNNLVPIKINVIEEEKGAIKTEKEGRRKRGRISLGELAIFSRQFSTMLDAGVSIIDILSDLSEQSSNKYFKEILENIKKDIEAGSNFSNAISKYPKVFSPLYVALVRAGEESGNLPGVMSEISSYIEDQIILLRKLRQALSYPVVILVFFICVVAFIFLFLIPKFQSIFSSFGAQLPLLTLLIFKISQFALKFLPLLIGFFFLFAIFIYFFKNTKIGRWQIDNLKLKFPLVGKLMHKIALSRFSSSLSTLIGGGVSINTALEIVAQTAGNVIIEDFIKKVREGVIGGKVLNEEMKKYKIFPPILVRMVRVGEETGKLEDMLKRTSKFFKDESDATINILTAIIEPVLIIGLGVVVGIVVIAIYLPIFKLSGTLK